MVGTNVLGNATGFACGDLGTADVIQQRCLAVVDVTHHGHHRCTWQGLDIQLRHIVVGKRFRIVQRSDNRLVAHFFHHDHRGVLVQRLVDGDHLAHLHQRLDHFRRLDCHLVRQFGHSNGFRHVHFNDAGFHRRGLRAVVAVAVIAATAATRATAPVGRTTSTGTGVTTGLEFFLLGRIASPAG